MRLGYSLHLEQTQKLIMTPELRQAITILQMPVLELSQYVEEQLLENPLLETKDDLEDSAGETATQEQPTQDKDKDHDKDKDRDMDWLEYFQDKTDLGIIKPRREEINEFTYENFLAVAPTLQEYLMQQLSLAAGTPEDSEIGEYLIGNIDDNGYLNVELEEAAATLERNPESVQRVLAMIQGFDPTGVGARNLQECLRLQLEQVPDAPNLALIIIQAHLADLAAGRITKISVALNVTPKEVQDLADFVRTLDPKPGRKFSSGTDTKYVVPDVIVEKVNGEYIVLVNDTSIPRLSINRAYKEALSGKVDEDAKRFVEDRLHSAASLIRGIEQRRLTMYRVVNCIIEQQRAFFDKGIKYLKPMTLKQVAEILGLHESTISRATSTKFMQAPQGVFELKFFFASGVDNHGGDATSSESIKKSLAEMVEQENPANPLSDQRLTDMLLARGINIARRTVAKYRDELGIPPTTLRKRY